MKAHPANRYLVCKQVQRSEQTVVENGLQFKKETLPIYEIIEASDLQGFKLDLSAGDNIVIDSIPSAIPSEDGSMMYLVSLDNVVAKVLS